MSAGRPPSTRNAETATLRGPGPGGAPRAVDGASAAAARTRSGSSPRANGGEGGGGARMASCYPGGRASVEVEAEVEVEVEGRAEGPRPLVTAAPLRALTLVVGRRKRRAMPWTEDPSWARAMRAPLEERGLSLATVD